MLPYDNQPAGTVARARNLRRDATDAEKALLRGLRDALPTRKWRFQVPMGPFFADLLCFSEKLVIEIDGGQHADAADHAQRTAFIEGKGFRVLRVSNDDVLANLDGVLTQIAGSFREKDGATPPRKDMGHRANKKGEQAEARSPSRSASRRSLPLPKEEGQ